jgi:hypothetical protein
MDLFRDQRFAMATSQKFSTQTPLKENRIKPMDGRFRELFPDRRDDTNGRSSMRPNRLRPFQPERDRHRLEFGHARLSIQPNR